MAFEGALFRIAPCYSTPMAFGGPKRKKTPLGVFVMLLALVLSAVAGAAAGLVWQSSDWFGEEPEDEIVTGDGITA